MTPTKPLYDMTVDRVLPHLADVHYIPEHRIQPQWMGLDRYERYKKGLTYEPILNQVAVAKARGSAAIVTGIEGGVPEGDGLWGRDWNAKEIVAGRLYRRELQVMIRRAMRECRFSAEHGNYNTGRPGYAWQTHTARQDEVEAYTAGLAEIEASDPRSDIDLSTKQFPAFYDTGSELTFANWKARVDSTVAFMERWHRELWPIVMPVRPNVHCPPELQRTDDPGFFEKVEYLSSLPIVTGIVIFGDQQVINSPDAAWLDIGRAA